MNAGDSTEAVTWLLAALEAAVVAVAETEGLPIPTQHWKKAQVAADLYASGAFRGNHAELLDVLNAGRKVAVYDGDAPDLGDSSLEDLALEVEAAVVDAEGDRP